jgi:hypothetical protein
MNDKNEFDVDFDFEKEYGFDPDILENTEFDEDDLLAEFLKEDAGEEVPAQPAPQFEEPKIPDPVEEPVPEEPAFAPDDFDVNAFNPDDFLNDAFGGDTFSDEMPLDFEEAPVETAPQDEPEEAPVIPEEPPVVEEPAPLSRAELRRIQKARKRKFKEVYLPAILAGISLVLMLTFIVGAVSRGISDGKTNDDAAIQASKDADAAAEELDREAAQLLAEAQELASGYNFQAAIQTLDSFSGELTSYPELLSAKANYSQQLTQVRAWNDPSQITNLSFHVLIADPSRAFSNKGYGNAYNKNFVTTDEFEKILDQLYANGYVLVDLDSIVTETKNADGSITYSANTIYLPSDKTPIMLTETMVNYFSYMVDSDKDGKPDAKGGGFANRLVVDSTGEIKAEMVNAAGETVVGNYDFVPILEDFIAKHPDFSYQGARATLAVCGYEGIFGYRVNAADEATKQAEIEGATKVVNALREKGYEIACYTWENIDYNAITIAAIQNDLSKWFEEIKPVVGEVDIMVFARHIDITDYSGGKFNVLYSSGFRYFMGASTAPMAEVTNTYFHQKRLLVTGTQMAYASTTFNKYFNAMAILNDERGTVPT